MITTFTMGLRTELHYNSSTLNEKVVLDAGRGIYTINDVKVTAKEASDRYNFLYKGGDTLRWSVA